MDAQAAHQVCRTWLQKYGQAARKRPAAAAAAAAPAAKAARAAAAGPASALVSLVTPDAVEQASGSRYRLEETDLGLGYRAYVHSTWL